jgi:predicted RNase H-like HicB family nuclease
MREVIGVFSKGATLPELQENIQDASRMIMSEQEESEPSMETISKELSLQV